MSPGSIWCDAISPSPPVVDYSLDEQPVMVNDGTQIRQMKWIDGKPIYKRTWYRSDLAFADDAAVQFASFPEATTWMEQIVKHEMTFTRVTVPGEATTGVTNLKLLYVRDFTSATGWGVYTALHMASEAADRWLTLYYTKTTDVV
jgi:hypothetical protein